MSPQASSGRAGRPYRLAVLNTHPIQYFAPLYRRLAREPEIDLTVYYCSRQGAGEYLDPGFGTRFKWDVPLLEGYRYRFLANLRSRDEVAGFASLVNPRIVSEIWRRRYDALWLHSYRFVTPLMALPAASLRGTAVFYRSESSLTYDARVRRPAALRAAKRAALRALFSRVRCFLAIGTENERFYRAYGAPAERIFAVPYAVDNEYFARRAREERPRRDEIRDELGVARDAAAFLFAAKMTHKKRPLELIRAYERVSAPRKALVVAGDGELRGPAEAYVRRRGVPGVRFLGFVNQSDLPRVYAASDVLVRPDGVYKGDWGLTVNEAMASGLAVIATDAMAASVDLVADGENGYVVRHGDDDELTAAMERIAADPEARRKMGRRSEEIIAGWSYEECVGGVLAALRSVERRGVGC